MSQSASDLPTEALREWCEAQLPGFSGPVQLSKFSGGQSNPTYRLTCGDARAVLRRKPFGALLPGAHAVEREFQVLQALAGTTVPVAKPLALCLDESVVGAVFYVMAHVEGRVFFDPSLPDIEPAQRAAYFHEWMDVLARLHALGVPAGLAAFGKPNQYFERQISTWTRQYRAAEMGRIPAMESLIAGLPAACPPDEGQVSLVHGDCRIDNFIWHPSEPRILAVVDWELATLGHPAADLAYAHMALRLPRNPVLPGLAGLDRAGLGIPDEAALVARYHRAGGPLSQVPWHFALAFSFFRLAAIAQGVAKRAEQGNASSARAVEAGRMTTLLAELGAALL